MDSLARHRAHHERPEAKQRLPMKRQAAPEPGPIPKQRRTVLPPRTPMGNPVGPDVLPEDPETIALYRQHCQSIRTEEATGNRGQDRYNFTLHEMTASTFTEMVHQIFRPYEDNLCFFRCLAVHRGAPVTDVEVPAKTHYHQYLQYRQMASNDLQGVYLDDLMVSEQLFSLNVYVYDLQGMEEGDITARLGRCSPYS